MCVSHGEWEQYVCSVFSLFPSTTIYQQLLQLTSTNISWMSNRCRWGNLSRCRSWMENVEVGLIGFTTAPWLAFSPFWLFSRWCYNWKHNFFAFVSLPSVADQHWGKGYPPEEQQKRRHARASTWQCRIPPISMEEPDVCFMTARNSSTASGLATESTENFWGRRNRRLRLLLAPVWCRKGKVARTVLVWLSQQQLFGSYPPPKCESWIRVYNSKRTILAADLTLQDIKNMWRVLGSQQATPTSDILVPMAFLQI